MDFFEFAYKTLEEDRSKLKNEQKPLNAQVYDVAEELLKKLESEGYSWYSLCTSIDILYGVTTRWAKFIEEL